MLKRKDRRVEIRVSREMKLQMKAAAEAADMPLSMWIRLVLRAAAKEKQ